MNKSYLFNIILRMLIVAGLAAFLCFAILQKLHPALIAVTAIVVIIALTLAVRYQNRINAQIAYFFEAVRNEDFSLNIPHKREDKITQELVLNLKKVNQQIQDIVIHNYQQEQYFRKLIEQLETGILTFDENEHVLHANREVKKLLGLHQFTHLKQLQKVNTSLYHKIKALGHNEQKNIQLQTPLGEIELLVKASDLKNKDQHLHLLTIQDIKKELDARETDSWIKLIRVLTHEMMNSIAPVTSLSETLSNSFKDDGKAINPEKVDHEMIERTIRGFDVISEQGNGIIKFVESYRQIAALPQPNKKLVKLKALIDKVVFLYQDVSENIRIENLCIDETKQLMLDENQVSQVLSNLIKNSIEAIGDKNGGLIRIIVEENADKMKIRITDNGCGIPEEKLPEIFVPFFTTKEKGNGIGLSLSRQVMQMHNGSIVCQSEEGQETHFVLQFPRNR